MESALLISVCPGCLDFEEDLWSKGFDQPAVDIAGAVGTAEQGCSGCKIIARILEPFMKHVEGQKFELQVYLGPDWEASRRLSLWYHSGVIAPGMNTLQIEVIGVLPQQLPVSRTCAVIQGPCPWRQLITAARISGYTGSMDAIARTRLWLDECLKKHERCRNTSNPQLPTRVLRIDGVNSVKLHSPANEVAAYACLSHCWGGRPFIQTTTSTLQKHQVGIPWKDLPQTFQDAISFTYRLGVKYIWIDSLCIIQDSDDDWRHEGSKMSQIYKNSFITLSATHSSNPYEGCFTTSKESHLSRTMTFQNSSNEACEIHYREKLPDGGRDSLNQRGWTFQERLLSKRIVHFMEQELEWECVERATCECSLPRHAERISAGKHDLDRELRQCPSNAQIQRNWEKIVEKYTRRSLTYPSDIFPALQGLAKLVPSSMGRYLAGHWEVTLVQSLCWYASQFHLQKLDLGTPKEWRAPTWSWASALCQVHWPVHRKTPKSMFATVLSTNTVSKGADPTGQISYGEIVLKGKCLTGRIAHDPIPGNAMPQTWRALYLSDNASQEPPHSHNATRSVQTSANTSSLSCQGVSSDEWLCCPYWDHACESEGDTQILVMKIQEYTREFKQNFKSQEEQCWVILKARDTHEKVYERLGLLILVRQPALSASSSHPRSIKQLQVLYDEVAVEMEVKIV